MRTFFFRSEVIVNAMAYILLCLQMPACCTTPCFFHNVSGRTFNGSSGLEVNLCIVIASYTEILLRFLLWMWMRESIIEKGVDEESSGKNAHLNNDIV